MKSIAYAIIFATLFNNIVCAQKIDTIQIKKQINSLPGGDAAKSALHKIIDEDQKFRGSQTNDSLDLFHLIWVSYFTNKFGYPSSQIFGHDAFSTSIIWIHNHRRLQIISFPIILKGFLSGEIKEKDLRDYYLRIIYTYKFDDDGYLHLPLKELFEKTELNISNNIPIEELIRVADEITAFENQPKNIIGVWKSDGLSKTYDTQGNKTKIEFEGEQAEIFSLKNDKVFICLSSSYGNREPQELYASGKNEYRYKNRKTNIYYTIEEEELSLINEGKVIKRYKKTN